jgi:hypothetical protein
MTEKKLIHKLDGKEEEGEKNFFVFISGIS